MYELIDYLTRDSCLVFVGAGPSCEIGLPDWGRLAEHVLEEVRKKKIKDIDDYEILFANQKFQELLGKVWRNVSPEFVLKICKDALRDPGKESAIYNFLVKFRFRGYLTTNFDNVFHRHFHDNGLAVTAYSNTKLELEKVDFAQLTCLVCVHGNLENRDSLVLTDEQYDDVIYSPTFSHLRQFLSSYLSTSRVLFVGYSLKDPDIQFLAKQSVHGLRRKTPLYAIVANASDEARDEWDRKYNIRIISYRNSDGKHSELRNIFTLLERYVALRGEEPPPPSSFSLEVAQSLYMWHRFQQESGRDARADAFASLVLSVLSGWRRAGEPISVEQVVQRVKQVAKMDPERISAAVEAAAHQNCRAGFLEHVSEKTFALTTKGAEANLRYAGQFDALQKEFEQQLELDFRKVLPHASQQEVGTFRKAVIEAICSAFAQRGAEIVQIVFSQEREMRPVPNLFKTINAAAETLPHELRVPFLNYLTDLLTRPKGVQERFVEYLAKTFFVVQALDLDPDGSKIRRSLLSNHSLVIDSNVLIPALALRSARNDFILELFARIEKAGLSLIVTPKVLEECISHCSWAIYLIEQFGEQSVELLSAALGRGQYRQNAFLDGFIRFNNDVKTVSFAGYLEECFGSPFGYRAAKEKLRSIGIDYFNPNQISSHYLEYFDVKSETNSFLEQRIAERPDIQKTQGRIEAETEVYAVVHGWDHLDDKPRETERKCSFLTYSSFLNKVAHEGPYPIYRNIVVRPDVLYEFVGRLEPLGKLSVPFKDVLLSTYFRSADYFIDKTKYARFFSPLLRHAEHIYRDSLESFRQLVSSGLTADSLLEVEELDRPFAVASLSAQADQVLIDEVNRLSGENYELKKELEKVRSKRGSKHKRIRRR